MKYGAKPVTGRMNTAFLRSAGVILGATGLAKQLSAVGPARVLDTPDPLLGLPFRQLLLLVGLGELIVAFFCLFVNRPRFDLFAVGCLSTNFLLYRMGLWLIGWHRPCGCMGSLTELLHIPPRLADNVMKVVLAYLLMGSYGLLLGRWWRMRVDTGSARDLGGT